MDSLTHVSARAFGSSVLLAPAARPGARIVAYSPLGRGFLAGSVSASAFAAARTRALPRRPEQIAPRGAWAGDRQSFAAKPTVRTAS